MTTTAALNRWRPVAEKIDEVPRRDVPLHILVSGARDIAEFVRRYWEPTPEHDGLKSAGPRLPMEIVEEIESLADAVEQTEMAYRATFGNTEQRSGLVQQAATLLEELTAALEWHLSDLDLTKLDADPAEVERALAHPVDPDELAEALTDYASLAEIFRHELTAGGAFDAPTVQQARNVARALGDLSTGPDELRAERRRIARLREQLAHLLQTRLLLVRQAARYVFRKQPTIVRQILDDDHRRLRAAQRRAQLMVERRARQRTEYHAVHHPTMAL